MKLNKNSSTNILIVGLGLIGGSYARGLTKRGYSVYAISRSRSTIDFAIENGLIIDGSTEVDADLVSSADVIVFGLYPQTFIEWIEKYRGLIRKGTLITDVSGVKSCVVYRVQELLGDDIEFIAAHPMAGRECYGVENSDERMFEGANYIVTPTEKNTREGIDTCIELGKELGFARISILTPEKHDEMIGFVSQLTHCIAVTLMTCKNCEDLVAYTGDSFRDLTRIAQINDAMWSELFFENRGQLLQQMDLFSAEFEKMKGFIRDGDEESLREMMRLSTRRRQLFNKEKKK